MLRKTPTSPLQIIPKQFFGSPAATAAAPEAPESPAPASADPADSRPRFPAREAGGLQAARLGGLRRPRGAAAEALPPGAASALCLGRGVARCGRVFRSLGATPCCCRFLCWVLFFFPPGETCHLGAEFRNSDLSQVLLDLDHSSGKSKARKLFFEANPQPIFFSLEQEVTDE